MENNIIVRKLVSSEISQELYESDVIRELGVSEDDVYDWDIIEETSDKNLRDDYSNEVTPVKIEDIERIIQNAKSKGATHVGIFYHEDHMEYEVYGYTYEEANQEYLDKRQQEKIKFEEAQRKAKIDFLKREAERLGIDIDVK